MRDGMWRLPMQPTAQTVESHTANATHRVGARRWRRPPICPDVQSLCTPPGAARSHNAMLRAQFSSLVLCHFGANPALSTQSPHDPPFYSVRRLRRLQVLSRHCRRLVLLRAADWRARRLPARPLPSDPLLAPAATALPLVLRESVHSVRSRRQALALAAPVVPAAGAPMIPTASRRPSAPERAAQPAGERAARPSQPLSVRSC